MAAKTIEPIPTNCPTCGASLQMAEKRHHVAVWCPVPGAFHFAAQMRRADSETLWGPVVAEAMLFETGAA